MPSPSMFSEPPIYKSPAIPVPPATVNAPVDELVATVVALISSVLNCPAGSIILIVPKTLPMPFP